MGCCLALPLEHDRIPPDTKLSRSHQSHPREGVSVSPGAQPSWSHGLGWCSGVTLQSGAAVRWGDAQPGCWMLLDLSLCFTPGLPLGSIQASVPPGFHLMGGCNIFPRLTLRTAWWRKAAESRCCSFCSLQHIEKRKKKTLLGGEVISKAVKIKGATRTVTSLLPSRTLCSSSPWMAPGSQHLEHCLRGNDMYQY